MIYLMIGLFLLFNGTGIYFITKGFLKALNQSEIPTNIKLKILYSIRKDLICPVTQFMITSLVEVKKGELNDNDKRYVENIWPLYQDRIRNGK